MRIPFLFRHGPVTLRPARTADAADLAGIHAGGFAHPWSTLTFEQLLADRGVIGHVAEGRGIAGFILSRIAADEAEILSIAVAPGQRGQGLGRRLVEENIRALVRQRVKALFLEVEDGNTAALALYRGGGFETVGTRRAYYRGPDGIARDALTMKRDLSRQVAMPPMLDV